MSSLLSIISPIVSVDWLQNNLGAKNLVILDGTINKAFDTSFEQIPNARFFDIKQKFSDTSNPFPSAYPSESQFQNEARALGINKDSAIVVYDDKGIYSSARVWWLFKSFGFENIAVLNGGFPAWKKAGFTTVNMSNYDGNEGDFIANLQTDHMKFFEDLEIATRDNGIKIIDARSASRFKGEAPEPREGLRSGTIPNSINLPFTDLIEDGLLKSKSDLDEIISSKADKDENIIFSCGSGITACILALGAELSGYKNISVYDGSWTEWGTLVKA